MKEKTSSEDCLLIRFSPVFRRQKERSCFLPFQFFLTAGLGFFEIRFPKILCYMGPQRACVCLSVSLCVFLCISLTCVSVSKCVRT